MLRMALFSGVSNFLALLWLLRTGHWNIEKPSHDLHFYMSLSLYLSIYLPVYLSHNGHKRYPTFWSVVFFFLIYWPPWLVKACGLDLCPWDLRRQLLKFVGRFRFSSSIRYLNFIWTLWCKTVSSGPHLRMNLTFEVGAAQFSENKRLSVLKRLEINSSWSLPYLWNYNLYWAIKLNLLFFFILFSWESFFSFSWYNEIFQPYQNCRRWDNQHLCIHCPTLTKQMFYHILCKIFIKVL